MLLGFASAAGGVAQSNREQTLSNGFGNADDHIQKSVHALVSGYGQ